MPRSSRLPAKLPPRGTRRGKTLLVLDNFEQLVSAAPVVRAWCQAAPTLQIVVTSRERLGVEGETVLELEPLGCPREGDPPPVVEASEAVRLFTLRANAAGGDLGSDPAAVGALVRQLEGIPLALELAAAQSRLFLPKELAARIARGGGVPASKGRPSKSRHATLAAAIEWSWNLLPLDEQHVFAALSVFGGSFAMDAAEGVLAALPGAPDVVAAVAALRDKSLLHSAGGGRLARYVSLRAYAAAKLGDPLSHAAGAAHARYFAGRARAFNESRTFQGAAPDSDLRGALMPERENLLGALAYARSHASTLPDAPEAIGEFAIALTLLHAAPSDLCRAALGLAIHMVELAPDGKGTLPARLLLARQGLLNGMGLFAESREDLETLLARGDLPRGLRTLALTMHGVQLRYQSFHERAWASHEAAERELGDMDLPRLRAMNWACMGRLACDFGDEARARTYNEKARALGVALGDRWLEAVPMTNLAQLEQEKQSFPRAIELLEQALATFRDASEAHYVAIYSAVLGDVLFEHGKIAEAREAYAAAAPFFGGWLSQRNALMLQASWAAMEAQQGDREAAVRHMDEARRTLARCDGPAGRLILELAGASLDLCAPADSAASSGDDAVPERWEARLRELEDRSGASFAEVARSFDVRFALRMARRALATRRPARAKLRMGDGGAWFELSPGARVDLSRRGSLKKILRGLARHARTSPGDALDLAALLALGWPGERVLPEAAGTRLRVAIATLRRLGLREVLLTREDGYLLDPALADAGPAGEGGLDASSDAAVDAAPTYADAVLAARWAELPKAPKVTGGAKQDDVFFTSATRGFAVSGPASSIYATVDGGGTWTTLYTHTGTYFRSILFVDDNHGFASNLGVLSGTPITDTTVLYETKDAGVTWSPVTAITGPMPSGICNQTKIDAQHLVAVGRVNGPAFLMQSSDGGASWTSKDLSAQFSMLIDARFTSTDGILVGGSAGATLSCTILATHDGGLTFKTMFTSKKADTLCWKINFPSPQIGYVSVQDADVGPPTFVKTTDGGSTWLEMALPKGSGIYPGIGVGFITDDIGWISADDPAQPTYRTIDGGKTWKPDAVLKAPINRFRFVDKNTAYAIGADVWKLDVAWTGP